MSGVNVQRRSYTVVANRATNSVTIKSAVKNTVVIKPSGQQGPRGYTGLQGPPGVQGPAPTQLDGGFF